MTSLGEHVAARASLALLILAMLGCSTQSPSPAAPTSGDAASTDRTATEPVGRPEDITSRPLNSDISELAGAPRAPVVQPGNGHLTGRLPEPAVTTPEGGDVSLSFVNADIGTVAKTVFHDILKANYSVDAAAAQTTLTLQTINPIHRADLLPLVEQSLRMCNIALALQNGVYQLIPMSQAAQLVNGIPAHKIGFGVDIMPLSHIGAAGVQRLLAPMIAGGTFFQTASDQNALVIGGPGPERAALIEDVKLLDVDWMAGMSFEMFTLQSAEANSVADELRNIMGVKNGPLDGIVRIFPISRLNAVLVASSQQKYLSDAKKWIEQLDRTEDPRAPRLYVYYVQNGRAADLAKVLNRAFGNPVASEASTNASATTSGSNSTAGGESGQAQQGSSGSLGGGLSPSGSLPNPGRALTSQAAPSGSTTTANAESGLLADLTGSEQTGGAANTPRITADIATNALLILADQSQYQMIKTALTKLDIAPLQVMLEAAVAEVTLTDNLQYGIQYYIASGHGQHHNVEFNPGGPNSFGTSTITPVFPGSNEGSAFPGFAYMFSSGADIRVILDALRDVTTVKVVSAPKLLVLSNQTAELNVGDQIPVLTSQSTSTITENAPTINQVQYVATGVILKLTPRVNEGGLVSMDVSQEVSSIASLTSGAIDSPTISDRKVSSTVAIRDGETVALGGMIQDSTTDEHNGIPGLQDIPLLGNLFRDTQHSEHRTELLVLITPHMLQSTEQLRTMTEALRKELPAARSIIEHP